jgi:hypothetical protein
MKSTGFKFPKSAIKYKLVREFSINRSWLRGFSTSLHGFHRRNRLIGLKLGVLRSKRAAQADRERLDETGFQSR